MNNPFLHDDWRASVALRVSPRARYLRIRIDHQGRVELVLPRGYDRGEALQFLDTQRGWVEKTLSRITPPEPLLRPEQITLPAIDQCWQVDFRAGLRGGFREQEPGILLLREGDDWPESLRRWLTVQGKRHLVPWLASVSAELALPFRGVTIRGQKTRWGSCSARGNINLNHALLLLPPEPVRYLLIHELCHTVHMNHSRAYWRLVERLCPDYRIHDRALRGAMARMPAWLHA
ncbi:MAG: M48 family metallopeptidase [Gammaproteobacteria bacterium]|nr:M48 family metallopeptidase [Gammaproteobacteria bacterium]